MKENPIITSGDGENRDEIINSEIYIALVTENFLNDDRCVGEMKDAFVLKKPMYAIIKYGTVLPDNFESFNWKEKFYFTSERDLEMIAEKIKGLQC